MAHTQRCKITGDIRRSINEVDLQTHIALDRAFHHKADWVLREKVLSHMLANDRCNLPPLEPPSDKGLARDLVRVAVDTWRRLQTLLSVCPWYDTETHKRVDTADEEWAFNRVDSFENSVGEVSSSLELSPAAMQNSAHAPFFVHSDAMMVFIMTAFRYIDQSERYDIICAHTEKIIPINIFNEWRLADPTLHGDENEYLTSHNEKFERKVGPMGDKGLYIGTCGVGVTITTEESMHSANSKLVIQQDAIYLSTYLPSRQDHPFITDGNFSYLSNMSVIASAILPNHVAAYASMATRHPWYFQVMCEHPINMIGIRDVMTALVRKSLPQYNIPLCLPLVYATQMHELSKLPERTMYQYYDDDDEYNPHDLTGEDNIFVNPEELTIHWSAEDNKFSLCVVYSNENIVYINGCFRKDDETLDPNRMISTTFEGYSFTTISQFKQRPTEPFLIVNQPAVVFLSE